MENAHILAATQLSPAALVSATPGIRVKVLPPNTARHFLDAQDGFWAAHHGSHLVLSRQRRPTFAGRWSLPLPSGWILVSASMWMVIRVLRVILMHNLQRV